MRFCFIFFISIFSFSFGASYYCYKITKSITIDGKLDEEEWKKASSITLVDMVTGEAPHLKSEFKVLWDDKYVYVGFIFEDPNVWAVIDLKRKRPTEVLPRHEREIMAEDTFAKIFLDPDADCIDYFEFHINPYNSVCDILVKRGRKNLIGEDMIKEGFDFSKGLLFSWDCKGLITAVSIDGTLNDFTDIDKGWSGEVAIPISSLSPFMRFNSLKVGDIWKFQFGRVWRKGPLQKRYYWKNVLIGIEDSHIPEKWKTMQFVEEKIEKKEKIWRGGWAGTWKNQEQLLATAKKLGFNALMMSGSFSYINELIPKAKKMGIDIYYCFSLQPKKDHPKQWYQKVSKEEEEKEKKIKEEIKKGKTLYQFGGEPVSDEMNVDINDYLCFHNPEVVLWCKEELLKIINECPGIAGIAFDFFGYKNYRGCRCEISEKLFESYYEKVLKKEIPKEIPKEKVWEQFSRDTLIHFYHELMDYIKERDPYMKFVTHIYPVFIPEPLYGNRIKVDYCCQTVAWFFEPYWPLEKVAKYTKIVIEEDKDYWSNSAGIPFVGIYIKHPNPAVGSKSIERFRQELKTIRQSGSRSISIHSFNVFIENPELCDILLEELGPGE